MRQTRGCAVLLAVLLSQPAAPLVSGRALGLVRGVVTVQGRPLTGAGLALVELSSGAIHRVTSSESGAFALKLSPGDYVLTLEGPVGLAVARAPALVPVRAGQVASADVELMSLSSALAAAPAEKQPFAIQHTPVGCLLAGEYSLIDATIEPADRVARARLHFKSALSSSFYFVEMTPEAGRFVGKLPKPKLEASPILYYVEGSTADGASARTPEHSATVVTSEAECKEGALAALGGPGAVQVFSAAGVAIAPVGFAASGIALSAGALSLIIGSAAAAGISATVDVFNPEPTPEPTPTVVPTPTPRPTPTPTPEPSPTPTPSPRPTPTPIPCATCPR